MKYTKENLQEAVKSSKSIYDVLRYFNVKLTGGSHYHVKNKIKLHNIDCSHFAGRGYNKGRKFPGRQRGWQEVLVNGNKETREKCAILTRCLLEYGLKYQCRKCGCDGLWQGEKITLEVNHRNENWQDNRPENLEFLCPNCHSQYKPGVAELADATDLNPVGLKTIEGATPFAGTYLKGKI